MWVWFHKLASPPYAYSFATMLRPWLLWISIALMLYGAYTGLFVVPADYQQKDSARIMYVHFPAGVWSQVIYVAMASAAAVGLIWRMKLAHALAASLAPIGAWITLLALITGSIWGRPMWGTWFAIGDARIMFTLISFFLYLGYMSLRVSLEEDRDTGRADRASAVLAIAGCVNVPLVKFSVYWWSSLHQGSTFLKLSGPSIDPSMKGPAYIMFVAVGLFIAALACERLRAEILRRERNASWLTRLQVKAA